MRYLSLLAALILGIPCVATAQVDFEQTYAGYSWTTVNHFSPMFGAADIEFLPDGNFLIAHLSGEVTLRGPTGNYLGMVLDLTSEVTKNGDSGMTSMALDPDFPTSPCLYLMYGVDTEPENPDTTFDRYGRITRYNLDPATNYHSVVAGSRKVLIGETWSEGILLEDFVHGTGKLDWGDDGTLLFSVGDGGHFGYTPSGSAIFGPGRFDSSLNIRSLRAQVLNCYNGKLSRIDRHTGLGLPSNPFWTGDGNDPQSRVWVYGLRNPWRFSILRGTGSHNPADGKPGAAWIGDVGLDWYEELNIASREGGNNFGWPFYEGPLSPINQLTYNGSVPWVPVEETTTYTAAIAHTEQVGESYPPELVDGFLGASMTGGVLYDYKLSETFNPASIPYSPILDRKYIFADWAYKNLYLASVDTFDRITGIDLMATNTLGDEWEGIVDLSYDPYTGKIYALTLWRLYRLDYNPAGAPPVAKVSATPDVGPLPLTATLDASESYDPAGNTLSYSWSIDGDAPIVTSEPELEHVFTENRNYSVSVTASTPDFREATASTTVYAGNAPPVVEIIYPVPAAYYPDDGTPVTIHYSGVVSDPDGVTDPVVRWKVALRHNDHRHDLTETFGLDGDYTLSRGETNTFYLFEMFATDDRGYTTIASRPIYSKSETAFTSADLDWQLYE